jgi:hypothetical protein
VRQRDENQNNRLDLVGFQGAVNAVRVSEGRDQAACSFELGATSDLHALSSEGPLAALRAGDRRSAATVPNVEP